MHVIIQAGGKGTRLESLTRNRPKCLVPVDNRPMIFWTFEAFKGADFSVIWRLQGGRAGTISRGVRVAVFRENRLRRRHWNHFGH